MNAFRAPPFWLESPISSRKIHAITCSIPHTAQHMNRKSDPNANSKGDTETVLPGVDLDVTRLPVSPSKTLAQPRESILRSTQVSGNLLGQIQLTNRDTDILETLGLKVRLISETQITDSFFGGSVSASRRRMKLLRQHQLVEAYKIHAHPLFELDHPVVSWKHGESFPHDFECISHELRKRWTRTTFPMTVYIASPKTAVLLYGRDWRPLPRAIEWSHDLQLTQIYLKYRRDFPELATRWIGEDAAKQVLPKPDKHEAVVDAIVLSEGFDPIGGVEAGGQYSASRCAKLVSDIRTKDYRWFEIW